MKTRKRTVTKFQSTSKLNAYLIPYGGQEYYVAALNDVQAIGTLMAHVEEDDAKAFGPCEKVDPEKVVVHFEKDEGYEKGSLSEIMPATDDPEVMIDPEYP